MARVATTTDVFNAIAEPRRRKIIDLLNDGEEWAVGDVVARMKIAQPSVSKHLGVLRKVFHQEHAPLSGAGDPGLPVYQQRSATQQNSASYLADHLGEVPVHIIPCVESRFETAGTFRQATRYGSILPAAWSLMLALRSRGLGTAWTTLHLYHEKEVAALLGIPDDVTQVVHLGVAYYTGTDFKPGPRIPARARTYWDGWGQQR